MKIKLPAFALLFLMLTPALQAQVGITSVPFLQIEPDSRAAGMGNTGVAIADNASAVFWNPAGLAFQRGNQVSITHSQWLPQFNADLFYDYLVGKYQVQDVGTFGAHITYLNLGEQLRTNEEGIEQGRFNSYEFSIGVSYGYQLNENWGLGTGVRYIRSSLFEGTLPGGGRSVSPGSSFGIDLAAMYKTNPFLFSGNEANFNAGINLSNIGPGINYTEEGRKDPLPTVLRFGWAFTTDLDKDGIHSLTLANDISKVMARSDSTGADGPFQALFSSWGSFERQTSQGSVELSTFEQFMVATGLEYWYNNLFAVRGGYYFEDPNNGNRRFITLGAGIRYDFVGIDFSYIYTLEEDHPLANTTRFGLLLDF
ncbi:MAG: type IX secretion system outer membrane channel protein PorV [Balneolaceae bacterium]|nr:type IX secretion system outer membrane channel protein PorV [Balneolaceae bacterium]